MRLLVATLFVFFSFNAFTQQYEAEKFEAALLQAKYGAMLVYNGEKNSFSLKFVSKAIEPTEKPNFVKVDDILMQASITPFQQKLAFDNLNEEAQRKWLLGWKNYERDWAAEQLKTKLTETEAFVKIGDKLFLQWTFNMPMSDKPGSIAKQVYLVTICFDQILVLNGPLENDKSESALLEKLKSVASTLKLNPGQVQDLEKLYQELMK
jgi:hypothetical protein